MFDELGLVLPLDHDVLKHVRMAIELKRTEEVRKADDETASFDCLE